MRRLLAFVVLVSALAGCTSPAPTGPLDRCTEPPAAAFVETGQFALELSPNPVAPGEEATLLASYDGVGEAIVGAGAMWQCWTGSKWETTHQLVKGPFGDGSPETNPLEPGVTWTIPAVGLSLPDSSQVVIPDVEAGTYRIWDDGAIGGGHADGFVIVVVE